MKEKFDEYQQVAAITCLDLDLLKDLADDSTITLKELKDYIIHIHEQKEKMVADGGARINRFNTSALLFRLNQLSKE